MGRTKSIMFNILNNINMSYLWDAEITQVFFLSTEEFGKATTRIRKGEMNGIKR